MVKKIMIPADPLRIALDEIKDRQIDRLKEKPQKITLDMVYEMLLDVIENQARTENKLNELLRK